MARRRSRTAAGRSFSHGEPSLYPRFARRFPEPLDTLQSAFEGDPRERSSIVLDTYWSKWTTRLRRAVAPVRSLSGTRHSPLFAVRATARSARRPRTVQEVISPAQLSVRSLACAKRQIRREVIFARGGRGLGSRARRRRRGEHSAFHC